jgi:hypothetical protein
VGGYNVVDYALRIQVPRVQARLVEPMDGVQVQWGKAQISPGFSDRGLEVPTDLTFEGLDRELMVPINKVAEGMWSL